MTMIVVNIDVMLAKRKMSVTELADKVGITIANLSILKNGKARAIRFSTLEGICKALNCQPGDILEYRSGASPTSTSELTPRQPILMTEPRTQSSTNGE
jgi:putative transcriptional regulator